MITGRHTDNEDEKRQHARELRRYRERPHHMIDAEKLKELAEKATEGKWYIYGPLTEEESCVAGGVEARIIVERPGYMVEPGVYEPSTSDELSNSDLELAVALRNSLPAILALVEREGGVTERERQMWRSAVVGLLQSADASWRENNQGHDWKEACERAEATLAFFSDPVCEQCKTSHKDLRANWRWNGRAWEHRCSDCHPQVGYWEVKAAMGGEGA